MLKRMWKSILICLMLFTSSAPPLTPKPQCQVVCRDHDRVWTYSEYCVAGWRVLIEQSITKEEKVVQDLINTLQARLTYLTSVVPQQRHAMLQRIPIWVSNEPNYPMRPGEQGVIPFHRSPEWLRSHQMNPEMAPGVHIINPKAVLYTHRIFDWAPETMLHELAHAYHNLELGLDEPTLQNAYSEAMRTKRYHRIPSRSNPKILTKAYAATNHEEYFAELTEAYFGKNDWYPHNREQLKQHDPIGFDAIEKLWTRP